MLQLRTIARESGESEWERLCRLQSTRASLRTGLELATTIKRLGISLLWITEKSTRRNKQSKHESKREAIVEFAIYEYSTKLFWVIVAKLKWDEEKHRK